MRHRPLVANLCAHPMNTPTYSLRRLCAAALTLAALLIVPAQAQNIETPSAPSVSQEKPRRIALGAEAGTTGYGGQFLYSLSKRWMFNLVSITV